MHFLIVKTSSLGDILQAFPALDWLRQRFPEAQIDWVVERSFSELVASHPAVNRVLTVDTRRWRQALAHSAVWKEIRSWRKQVRETGYDVAFDLQANVKSGLLLSQVRAQQKVGFGGKSAREWFNVFFTHKRIDPDPHGNIRNDYLRVVQSVWGVSEAQPAGKSLFRITGEQQAQVAELVQAVQTKILVCPGAFWRNKQLPVEAWIDLLQRIENAHFLLAWGNDAERQMAEQMHAALANRSQIIPKLPLAVLQHLMAQVDLVLAMDSLPLHLCGTTATPSFSVFGPSSAAKFAPEGVQHRTVQGSCPYGRTFVKRCPILRTCKTGACIRSLEGAYLFDAFKSRADQDQCGSARFQSPSPP